MVYRRPIFSGGLGLVNRRFIPQVGGGVLSYRDLILADSPVGYWRLGETSGIVAADEMGSNNGTYSPNSGGAWTGGTLGQTGAIASDSDKSVAVSSGSGGYVNLGSANVGGDKICTHEIWAKFSDGTGNRWITAEANTGGSSSSIVGLHTNAAGNGKVNFGLRAATSGTVIIATSDNTLNDGNWHHLVGTADGTTVRLYVDGVLQAVTGNIASQGNPNLNSLGLGTIIRSTVTIFMTVAVDEFAVYDAALSIAQIQAHYNKGMGL